MLKNQFNGSCVALVAILKPAENMSRAKISRTPLKITIATPRLR